ncbi:hypothetical protein B7Y94_01840 [Candidatus Saccharibacteria bacterium 32-49-12]|nr:MAG: hypothetical protein B7Y94_01840 [Candidatus Saccharibacteria bacterium 32-49-12]
MLRGMSLSQADELPPSLSVAAHELKSPITLMRQLALVLQDGDLSANERQRYHHQLQIVADQALQLTTDLAQVANLQPSLFPLEPVNPIAICQSLAYETSAIARLYGRNVSWPKARRNTILAVANPHLLRRIVANFVDNSLKYTEEGVPIEVKITQEGDGVRVAVRDYGPRLSLKEYRRLTDELVRLKTIRTRPESSGLGIYIAARFAEAMRGEIGLVRHRDGVTFYVDLLMSRQTSWLS